jgi:hypothetical protein
VNRAEQFENRVLVTEDKLEENMNEACKTSGTMKRQNLRIMGIEGEEIQTKGTYNLVNRIIAKVSYP